MTRLLSREAAFFAYVPWLLASEAWLILRRAPRTFPA